MHHLLGMPQKSMLLSRNGEIGRRALQMQVRGGPNMMVMLALRGWVDTFDERLT